MKFRFREFWFVLALSPIFLVPLGLLANENEATTVGELATPGGAAAGAPTHTVVRELMRIEVTLQGVVEAEHMEEVSIDPEVWTQLKVVEAVDHGARVRKGEPLVKLETEALDEAIEELESAHRLAQLTLEQKKIDVRLLEKTLPLDVESAEVARKQAKEDLERFLRVDRDESEKSIEFLVKKTRNYLEYQKEELRQLEEMYGADDLTEETEEIVLKRQRDAVENAMFSLERAKTSRDRSIGLTLPRQEESLNDRVTRDNLAAERAKLALPMKLEKLRIELTGLEHQLEKTAERLEKLRGDRSLMTIVAPTDGIVYYGQFVRGRWAGAASVSKKLLKGGSVSSREVLMTLVRPRPFFVRAIVPENELGKLSDGSKGTAVPTAYPDVEIPATILRLSDIPVSPGNFEARVELGEAGRPADLLPGMTCALRFTAYENRDALTVPARAVFEESGDQPDAGRRRFVFVVAENGGHEKRVVKTGRTVDGKTEIVGGLEEGDRILLERPKGE